MIKMNDNFVGNEYGYVVQGPFYIEIFRYKSSWSASVDLEWFKDGVDWCWHEKLKGKKLSWVLSELAGEISKKEDEISKR